MATIQIEVPDEIAAQWSVLPHADRVRVDAEIKVALARVATAPVPSQKSDAERATAVSRVLALLRLRENWGGYDMDAPNHQAAEHLLRWLLTLFDETVALAPPRFVAPMVSATPNGDAVAEWWRGEKSLSVFVNASGEAEYIKAWGKDIGSEMEEGDANIPETRQNLYAWLMQ